jgi:hypothetical protein
LVGEILKGLKSLIKRSFDLIRVEIHRIRPASIEFPPEANSFQQAIISNASKYSMTGITRMWTLTQAFKYVHENGILGDYVECGVWRGGNLILLSALQDQIGESRSIFGFDTFSGMTAPAEIDRDHMGQSASEIMASTPKIDGEHSIHAFASLQLVKANLSENNSKNIKLIQGDVAETLIDSKNLPEKIAILRLDTDWYESTKIELEILYPLLEPGGVLIIDDYGHFEGAKKAVDEYFHDSKPWMQYVDYSCRLIIKH